MIEIADRGDRRRDSFRGRDSRGSERDRDRGGRLRSSPGRGGSTETGIGEGGVTVGKFTQCSLLGLVIQIIL